MEQKATYSLEVPTNIQQYGKLFVAFQAVLSACAEEPPSPGELCIDHRRLGGNNYMSLCNEWLEV